MLVDPRCIMGYLNNPPVCRAVVLIIEPIFLRLSLPSSLQLYKKESFSFQMGGALCDVCAHFLNLPYLRSINTSPDKFLNGQKRARIRLSFTRDQRAIASVGSCSGSPASWCFLGDVADATGNVTSDIFGTKTWDRQPRLPPPPPPMILH